jgi:iron complex transport system substrate-binding protein
MKFQSLRFVTTVSAMCLFIRMPSAIAAIEVVDDTDRTVRLEQHAQRIVSLSPHITENLFAVGLGDRIVATVAHADFPPQAKDLPRIGGYNSLNLEALVQLQADLIITWGSGISYESQAKLKTLGIPIYVSEPTTLKDIQDNIKDFAKLGGLVEPEVSVLHTFSAALTKYPLQGTRSTVFYQIWNDPIQTLNGRHIVNDVFARCGLYNVFADAPSVAPTLNPESVIDANPDLIIASGIGNERPVWLDRWTKYASINAVKNNALHALNPDLMQRPTPRILDGLEQICSWSSQLRESSPNAQSPLP